MLRVPVTSQSRPRNAFTLLEIAVGAAMLAVLLMVVGKTVVAVEMSARKADDHAEALRVVDNLLEELLAAPWETIDAEAVSQLALPGYVQERWPAARVSGAVEAFEEPVPGKRIALTLSPRGANGRSVTMTTYIYVVPGS